MRAISDSAQSIAERPLTVREVAELMRVSTKTVMRAIDAGQLEASRITQSRGGWRVRPEAVDAWLDRRSNRTLADRPLQDVTPATAAPARPSRRSSGAARSGRLVA